MAVWIKLAESVAYFSGDTCSSWNNRVTKPREAQKISVVPTSLFSPAQTWKPDKQTAQNVNIL